MSARRKSTWGCGVTMGSNTPLLINHNHYRKGFFAALRMTTCLYVIPPSVILGLDPGTCLPADRSISLIIISGGFQGCSPPSVILGLDPGTCLPAGRSSSLFTYAGLSYSYLISTFIPTISSWANSCAYSANIFLWQNSGDSSMQSNVISIFIARDMRSITFSFTFSFKCSRYSALYVSKSISSL